MSASTEAIEDGESSGEPLVLLFVFTSLAIGIVIRFLVTHYSIPLPYTVCILVISALLALIEIQTSDIFVDSMLLFELMNPDVIVFVFLPVLLFEGAFALDSQYLGRTWMAALLLATVGVVIVTALMAVVGVYCLSYEWDWYTGLMFGALLAATDPVAVVAIMNEIGGSKALSTIIDGESLLNDGTAYTLYLVFLQFVTGQRRPAHEVVEQFLQIAAAGPLFGLGCGIIVAALIGRVFNHPEVEITSTVVAAYLTFFLAQGPLQTSGVLAIVIFGIYMGYHRNAISPDVRHSLHATWSFLSYVANTLIFSLAGVIVGRTLFVKSAGTIDGTDVGNLVLVYLMCNVQRVISVAVLWPLIRRCVHAEVTLNRREFLQLSWSGLRGGMTLVLALLTNANSGIDQVVRSKILFLSAGVVLLTLVINATTSRPLLECLGLDKGDQESQIVVTYARKYMASRTEDAVATLKEQAHMQSVNWTMLEESIPSFLEGQPKEVRPESTIPASPVVIPDEVALLPAASEPAATSSNETQQPPSPPPPPLAIHPPGEVAVKEKEEDMLGSLPPSVEVDNARHLVTHRLLAFLKQDFVAQYSAGLITAHSLNILVGAVRVAQDDDDLSQQWRHIRQHFVLSPLLLKLYSSNVILHSFFSSRITKWLFSHLAICSELALALANSRQRLDERVSFFQSDLRVDAKTIDAVQTEFIEECAAAEEAANDVMTAFPKVREALETRHAMQFILRFQRSEIEDLSNSGLLEDAEAMKISAAVEAQIYHLQLRPWEGRVELPDNVFLSLPFAAAASKEHQARLLRYSRRRVIQHGHAIDIPPDSLGVILRGVALCEYFGAKNESPRVDCWLGEGVSTENALESQTRTVYHLAPHSVESAMTPLWHEKVSKGGLITLGTGIVPQLDPSDLSLTKKNTALTFCEVFILPVALILELGALTARVRYLLLQEIAGQLLRSRFQEYHNEPDIDAVLAKAKMEWCALGAFEDGKEVSPTNKVYLVPGDRWLLIEGSGRAHYVHDEQAHEQAQDAKEPASPASGPSLSPPPSHAGDRYEPVSQERSRGSNGRLDRLGSEGRSEETKKAEKSMLQMTSMPSAKPYLRHKSMMRDNVFVRCRSHTLPSELAAPFFVLFECAHSHREQSCNCSITIEVSRGAFLHWRKDKVVPAKEAAKPEEQLSPSEVSGAQTPPSDLIGVFQALTRQPSGPMDFSKLDDHRPESA